MHRRVRHLNPAQCGAQVALDARFITGVADGGAVSTWTSRPVASINATQAAGTSQPTYRAAFINGRPSVDFDGSDDFMSLSAASLSLTNNVASAVVTAVVLDEAPTTGDSQHHIVAISTGGGTPRLRVQSQTSGGGTVVAAGRRLDADSTVTTTSAGPNATPMIVAGEANWVNNSLRCMRNGAASMTQTFSSGGGNTSATNSTAFTIGAANASTNRLSGGISALVMFVPIPADAVRQRVRHHLGFSFRIATH